jgi:glycosyltransferase involved in cell wall biosynthesis
MTNISVIILQKNEALHIKRCLERLAPLEPRQIFVVDCFSTDGSDKTAAKMGAAVVYHEWPGLQSVQFNWALDNLEIESKWILRLDADEYLTAESIDSLKANLDKVEESVCALEFTLERKFMGGVIRHGTNGIPMIRMFRNGRGRYAETLMDERIVYEGDKLSVPVVFYDDNLNSLEWWKEKHRGYAKREAQQALEGSFQDPRKAKYYKLPRYLRALLYFCVRYFLKCGFLDGRVGWRWHFWQGLWYRWVVDQEIGRMKGG